nr:immunoglobulin light chain junction region [Macaca mulatta]MOX10275.1 immunoglobulin light chain junction region [Macaca mulatta]MOX10906.1 immunoglobulin light chain junction region [Macaca mulatta]
CQQYSRLPWTF